jgi:ankyrin repeat protein
MNDSNKTLRIDDDSNKTLDVTNKKTTFLNYKITNYLEDKIGGEAEAYIIKYNNLIAFAKFYKPNVKVNLNILNKIKRLADQYDYFPKIYEIGKKENRVYEIQEYLNGGSLREKLNEEKNTVKNNIKKFIKRVAEALNILHKEGIIHRDLKPENILYRKDDPVLTDFGATTFLDQELSRKATGIVGTNMYMAPEAVIVDFKTKKSIIGKEVDWWALGIIILEILNKNPFEGIDSASINYLIAKKPIPIPEELDEKYKLLLKGLLTKDEKKRWSYEQVKEWLEGKSPEVYFEEKIEEEFDFEFKGAKYTPEQLATQIITKENFDDAVKYFDKGFFSEAKIKDEKNPYRAQLLDLFDLKTSEEKVIFFSYTILKANNHETPFSLYGIEITDKDIINILQKYVTAEYLNETEKKIINSMEEGIFKKSIDIYEKIYNKKVLKIKDFLPYNLNLENTQELLNICNNYFNENIELIKILLKYIQIPSNCAIELLSNNELYKIIKNNELNLKSKAYIKGLIVNGYINDVKELVKALNDEYLKTALKYDQIEIAKYLLDLGTNPNIIFVNKNYKNQLTPLIYSIANNDTEFTKKLLDKGADPNLVPAQQNAPLMQAVVNNNKEIINLLLEYNADINLISGINIPRTALHEAVSINNKEIAELLLKNNADPNIKSCDNFPKTPLFTAVENENKEIIELLLKYNANPNIMCTINENGYEWTPLFEATIRENKEIIELLLKYKANPNIKCNNNLSRTPLHEIVIRNNLEIAELLLKHKADPNIISITNENGEERTPLHSAIIAQNKEMVELLLKYNADPNIESNTGLTPLYSAVINENYEIIKLLLKYGVKIDFETAKYIQNNNKKLEKLFFEKTIKKTRIKNIIQGTLIIFISLILFYRILLVHYYHHPNSLFEKNQFKEVLLNPDIIDNPKFYIFGIIYNSIPPILKPIIINTIPKKIKKDIKENK